MNPTIRNRSAFPEAQPKGYQDSRGDKPGMTLRQYYAGQALIGMAADPNTGSLTTQQIATSCVALADALCEELAKQS